MDTLKTYGLAVHWIAFIFGVMLFLQFIMSIIDGSMPDRLGLLANLIFCSLVFLVCNGLGWLFRFVVSGKIHFLPWK